MSQKRKEFFIMVFLTVFMIAIAVSSCESRGTHKEKHFPTRVGSGIR
tara:strand:- start:570 stop:710 length:141 start_codon:yes stop_codon:yes gene_type:complete